MKIEQTVTSMRIEPEILEKVRVAAFHNHCSKSEFMRRAILSALTEKPQQAALIGA